ncbi:MAG: hypothetical protein NVSMB19_13240 [Vulcanimicrobiaceae bacterium]
MEPVRRAACITGTFEQSVEGVAGCRFGGRSRKRAGAEHGERDRENDCGETHTMGFEVIDGYLLGEPISKAEVVGALLAQRSGDPAAAPFYRALEAVGVRAADEAFLALRLVLAGRSPEDGAVRRLRALAAVARACARDDRAGLTGLLARERPVLGDLAGPLVADLSTLGLAAVAAYRGELAAQR